MVASDQTLEYLQYTLSTKENQPLQDSLGSQEASERVVNQDHKATNKANQQIHQQASAKVKPFFDFKRGNRPPSNQTQLECVS